MYLHPGAAAVSEFARQHKGVITPFPMPPEVVEGQYRHAECVETSAYEIALALGLVPRYSPALVGDYLQRLVDDWHAHNPGVDYPQGASSYGDAAWWLRKLGATVDDNLLAPGFDWYGEMLTNLPKGYVYLVGVCNAQALPGDELGVHCHGLAALGVDDSGRIICGDPDNAHTQANMAGNPYGNLVSYRKADFVAADLSSLTRVHPMSVVPAGWHDDGHTLTDPNGKKATTGMRTAILNSAQVLGRVWDPADTILEEETHKTFVEVSQPGLGAGTRLVCRYTVLCWTAAKGVFLAESGADLSYMETHAQPTDDEAAEAQAAQDALAKKQATSTALASAYAAIGKDLSDAIAAAHAYFG